MGAGLTTIKLLSQLEHVDIATPLARSDEGNISWNVRVSD